MKYYLGYYDSSELKPIELEETEPTILSVVKFTTNFDNLNSLKQYLLNENKIPNHKVFLYYVMEKGRQGQKYFEALKTDKIYTKEYSPLFTIEGIKNFIAVNKYDENFITLLFSAYLRKYGFMNILAEYFKKRNIEYLLPSLGSLSKVVSPLLSSKIKYLINSYSTLTNEKIASCLDYIINSLKYSSTDLINAYFCLGSSVDFNSIPTIRYLHNWFSIVHEYNQTKGKFSNDLSGESPKINSEVNAFLNSIMYDYDSKKREYKKIDGKRKIQERQLFDLGVILDSYYKKVYDEYLETIYPDDDTYDEDAEFLCQEDFERLGTTSEESGIKIRKIYK